MRITIKLTIQNYYTQVSIILIIFSLIIKALKKPSYNKKKDKKKYNKIVSLDNIIEIIYTIYYKLFSKDLKDTIKEILDTTYNSINRRERE